MSHTLRHFSLPRRLGIALAIVLAAALVAAAIAFAGGNGGPQVSMVNTDSTDASTTSSTTWEIVPKAALPASVPPGATRLINARFTAESACARPNAGSWCSVRIVAIRFTPAEVITPLEPNPGMDFAFDADEPGSNFNWDSNAIERSLRLPAGDYRIVVQHAVTNSAVDFRLDDWHFAVETSL
jgi:hypothetical protein